MYLHHLLEKIKDDDNDEMIACLIITAISLENFLENCRKLSTLKANSYQTYIHLSLCASLTLCCQIFLHLSKQQPKKELCKSLSFLPAVHIANIDIIGRLKNSL